MHCRRLKHAAAIGAVALLAIVAAAQGQTNAISPSTQAAVANLLKRLTNEQAVAEFKARLAKQFPEPEVLPLNVFTGWSTNGPAVYAGNRLASTNQNTNPLWLELHRLGYPTPPLTTLWYYTNQIFHHFLPDSLNNLCWTNFIAHTNGRTTQIWSVREHPANWPKQPPRVRWNTNSLMWGMRGLTAISPCCQIEPQPGVPPITALTRRHGYTRGHGMRPDGFRQTWAGNKVWFLTLDNRLVETTIIRDLVRTAGDCGRDYTLFLFSSDLPDSITPIRVIAEKTRLVKYSAPVGSPVPIFLTEQTGNTSAEIPGFTVPTMKGGDSGSPNMIPMPGELVFYSGRTTSGPSPEMQADMDELCRLSGIDPKRYQLEWVDLSGFTSY